MPSHYESSLKIRTLFFAAYRDLLGTGELELRLPEGATVGSLVEDLRGRGGPWATLPEDPAVAVNQEYASSGTSLSDGDEVALIPPVAGG